MLFDDIHLDFQVCESCSGFDTKVYKRKMRKHTIRKVWKESGFYDVLFENPAWWNKNCAIALSQKCGLGCDAPVMFATFSEYEWFYCKINANVFHSVMKVFHKIQHDMAILPFWCLEKDKKSKQHYRHMIIALRKPASLPLKHIIPMRTIANPFELSYWIFYVGHVKDTIDRYWIQRPIYPHGILGMSTLYPGGLKQYMQWIRVSNRMDHEYDIPKNCVVPVCKELGPWRVATKEVQNKSKLYLFRKDMSLIFHRQSFLKKLPNETWFAHQKNSGNSFMEILHYCNDL